MTENQDADAGSILKQARLRRGQSLEVVFQHTRIQKKFIEAMEGNRLDEFPAHVYLRGFLKIYCDHLDLEFEPLWNRMCPAKPEATAESNGAPSGSSPAAASAPQPNAGHDDGPAQFGGPLLWIAVALLLGAGGLIWLTKSRRPPPPPAAVQTPPPPPIAPLRLSGPMKLKITFKREAWLSLRCDGQLRFEGRASGGTEQEWPAASEFTLRTASTDDVALRLDDAELALVPEMRDPSGAYRIVRK